MASGDNIAGAVPDSLKPDSGTLASSVLTSNPIIAYELTGWSYEDPHAPAKPKPGKNLQILSFLEGEEQANPEGHPGAALGMDGS